MANWFEWDPTYAVGIEKIDDQHRGLFKMLNDLGDALWDGKGKDSIAESLKFMAEYTVEHFATEERYMLQHNYPNYRSHKQVHDGLIEEVTLFITRFESEDLGSDLTISVVNRLGEWTRRHVRGMDQELGDFLRKLS